jgi:predicted HTH transcriptional regulator
MALANTRGGYIVVGVGEDANGNPLLHTGLTEKQAR